MMFDNLTENEVIIISKEYITKKEFDKMPKGISGTGTKVSRKQILPMLEELKPLIASVRIVVEKIPEGTKRKSLMLTVEHFEKKIAVAVKEISEQDVMDYVNKHPEVLQKYAKMAASDEGMKEEAMKAVSTFDLQTEKEAGKKKNRR